MSDTETQTPDLQQMLNRSVVDYVKMGPDEAVSEFGKLLGHYVQDPDARAQLLGEFRNRSTSPLARETRDALRERDRLDGEVREHTYKHAGIPDKAYDLVAQAFEGDHHDIEAVRAYGQDVGLVPPPEPKPGDPGYLWRSPAERRAYEEGNSDE